nr:RNA-directed DNA polymerase, eukaryota [Tanacetum cinerariifolium]
MSKLDRLLISEGLLSKFLHLSALYLDIHLSDHRLILMRESSFDYGPSPFWIFHSWFSMEGFDSFVETTWKSMNVDEPNGLIRSKKKLQLLKNAIKVWLEEIRTQLYEKKINIQHKLLDVDKIIDQGTRNVEKWCKWINNCLENAMGLVLVNGSPTSKFQFHKGLKQGDLIFPFLFILVMESLYQPFKRVTNAGLYKGILLNASFVISHMFYADDVVFVREWNASNIKTIANVLKCFFLASGLKINFHKSKLMGVGVNSDEVDKATSLVGCSTFTSPLKYLGVKVGGNMSRINSWEEVITKSMGLRLWKKVDNRENTSFWDESWLQCKSISVADKLRHSSLTHSFRRLPRSSSEEVQHDMLRTCMTDVILPNMDDRWIWSLNASGVFSVKSTRNYIDDIILPKVEVPSRSKILRWWEIDDTNINSYSDWLNWLANIRLPNHLKIFLE